MRSTLKLGSTTRPKVPNLGGLKQLLWPYFHPFVLTCSVALLLFSVAVGYSAGISRIARDKLPEWVAWLTSINLAYEFPWVETLHGEGGLFWFIAEVGYEAHPKNIAKFPLYPAVARAVWELSGRALSVPFILWLLHAVMVWAGLAELFRFWEGYRPGLGRRAVMWVLFGPLLMLQVWLTAYIEPGFLALMWGCLTLERHKQWAWGALLMTLLVMLQPSGIFLGFLIGLRRLWLFANHEVSREAVLWALLPGVIWLGWMTITSIGFGRIFAPYAFQEEWGRTVWRWPWDRWHRYVVTQGIQAGQFGLPHIYTSIPFFWITAGFIKGGHLWLRIGQEKRTLLLGWWVMPIFAVLIVWVPFATHTYGLGRYAVCSIIAVWPLLFDVQTLESKRFKRFEKGMWLLGAVGSLLVIFAFVAGLSEQLQVFF
jgi:hypothetical protein